MITYLFQHRGDGIVIGNGLFALALYFVRHFSRLHHGIYMLGDENGSPGNLFDEFHVLGRQLGCFFRREELFHFIHIVYQLALVFGGYGDDVVHRQVAQHARLDLDFLCVSFPFHFIARLQLLAGHHAGGFEHGDARGLQVVVENERAARFAVQTPVGGLRLPFVRVAVAVKADRLALLDVAADNFDDGGDFRFTLFDERVHVLLEPGKLFGNGRVERNHGTGTVCLRRGTQSGCR